MTRIQLDHPTRRCSRVPADAAIRSPLSAPSSLLMLLAVLWSLALPVSARSIAAAAGPASPASDPPTDRAGRKSDQPGKARAGKQDSHKKDSKPAHGESAEGGKSAEEGKSAGDSKPPEGTVLVQRGPFRIEVTVKGYFEPERAEEVRLQPKAWGTFKVAEVVPHGARVEEGEVILRFDTEKLERQIEELRRQVHGSELKLAKMRIDREQHAARRRLDREALERSVRQTLHQWEQFQKTGRAMAEEGARRSLESSRYQLEYALEELKQLKKMYEADELTEETEEIVLKRTARAAESEKWYLRRAEVSTAERLDFEIPHQTAELKAAAERARLDEERHERVAPLEEEEFELSLAREEREHEKLVEQLERHEHDLESMTVRAPFAGIVYYGELHRGRSGDAMATAARLRPGATVTLGTTLLTVVADRPLRMRADLAEKDLYRIRRAQRCRITATAFPEAAIAGTVAEFDTVPLKPGLFDLVIRVESIPEGVPIMPGMACQGRITAYHNATALTVPASAVREEDGEWTVERLGNDGRFERRTVQIGRRTKEKVEIVDGLRAGDRVKQTR